MMKRTKIAAAVSAACSILASPAMAQDTQLEEVVVTGIRGSMQMAMDVKRDSSGVVDAISAEDMGKFPDTNLAESLQRISGVSIDRSQGEGSEVTVRGFGGQFNLVTLNGRQMPSANVPNTSGNSFGASGNSRSFDFSTLASEGVSGLQVYKTGRASAPTGGIGATINVNTIRPLEAGNQAALGAKLVDDKGGDMTPEFSGLLSWANDDDTLGVSLFASQQEREGSQRSGLNSGYVWAYPYDPTNGAFNTATHTNEPATGQLAAYPTNNRLDTSTYNRERTNAFLTVQYAPSDRLMITADAYYAINEAEQDSNQSQQWLARNFDTMEWDASGVVSTPLILSEFHASTVPAAPFTEVGTDIMDDNRTARQNDEIKSFGLNFDYRLNDSWTANLDVAVSDAESKGGFPGGVSVYRGVTSSAASGWRAFDLSGPTPNTLIAITDGAGNQNGTIEATDIGSQQVFRDSSSMTHEIDQFQLTANWNNGGNITVDMGVGMIDMKMEQASLNEGNELGGWGVAFTGDVEEHAPGLLYEVCGICKYKDTDFQANRAVLDALAPAGASTMLLGEQSWRVDPYSFWWAMDGWDYRTPDTAEPDFDANNPLKRGSANNVITEDVTSAFVSTTMEGEIGNKPMQIVAGLRWEETDVTSATVQAVPTAFRWDSDNDTTRLLGTGESTLDEDYKYDNLLPSLDFSVDLTDEWKARASFSRTIARPQYNYMFIPTNVNHGGTLTYLGGVPTANRGSAMLDPLVSDNFDLSFEYYYGDANYASIGYFQKAVSNFVGIEQVERQFFGLRNVTARVPGNRLDIAINELEDRGFAATEESIFTMTAILDNPGDFPGGADDYDGSGSQAVDVLNGYAVMPNGDDPLYTFQTALPVNNKTANIDGYELAIQHFFGETGFGIQANATLVSGDIAFDNGAPPNFDQFALEGLSDSANLILVWENDTFGARIAYNWRDAFLSQANAGNFLPRYTDEFSQVDVNFSWNVTDQFSLSLDGINLTEEGVYQYGRTYNMGYINSEADARWVLAARYNF